MRRIILGIVFVFLSAALANAQTVICSFPFRNTAGQTIAGGLHVSQAGNASWLAQSMGGEGFNLFLQSQSGSEYDYTFSFRSNRDNDVMEVDLFAGDVSCSFTGATINGHTAWLKAFAKSAVFPLNTWAKILGVFAAAMADPNSATIASGIELVAFIAEKFGDDPPDCTDGIAAPDFSNVIPFDASLVGVARLASRIQFNTGMIAALGEAALTAQNRFSCPTRSPDDQAAQFSAAQGFTNRMGNRLLNLQNQMVRATAYAARKGMDQGDVDTLNQTLPAAGEWGMSLASGASE